MVEEVKCSMLGYTHELDEAKKDVFAIVHACDSDIETKVSSLNHIITTVSNIESKSKAINSMSSLMVNSISKQDEEDIETAKVQIQGHLNEVRKLINSETNSLNNVMANIVTLQTELDMVRVYTTEKRSYFENESPVSDEEGTIELEPLKVLCSEIESWKMTVDSLHTQISSLKARPCTFEYDRLMEDHSKVSKEHQLLLEEARSFLKTKTEYYDRLRKIDDLCELSNIWLETKSKETLNLIQYHSLKSNGMTAQISQLQRIFNDIKENEDDTAVKAKELTKLNKHTIESEDLDELKESFVNLKEIVLKNIRSLNDVFEERKEFEKSLEYCVDWIKNAESIVFCDIPDTGHKETLNKHLERFSEILREKEDIQETLESLSLQTQKILPTLISSDQITLKSNLEFYNEQVDQISARCEKKVQDLSTKIESIETTQEANSEYENRLKGIKQRLQELKRPIDVNKGGLQDTLEVYKSLSEELNMIRNESHEKKGQEVVQMHCSKQDEVIAIIAEQIAQTTELMNLQDQYKNAVTTITEDLSMVTSELDNIMDTEEPASTSPELRSLNLKVQDCESHLSLAMDKGDQLAVHFSPQDQNEMSALLGSLKTRIHQVKRQTSLLEENQPAQGSSHEEHETIEKLIAELLQLENEIKCKPIIGIDPEDIDKVLTKHINLERLVKEKCDALNSAIDSQNSEHVSKAEQANIKLAESMISVLPRELLSKREFLNDQKNARNLFHDVYSKLTEELDSAKVRASCDDDPGMTDFLSLDDDLNDHQTRFRKLPSDPNNIKILEELSYKISQFTSKDQAGELDKKKQEINSLVDTIQTMAKTKEENLQEKIMQWKLCTNLAPEIEQVVGRVRNTSLSSFNIQGLRRTIEDCTDNIKLVEEHLERFQKFSDTMNSIKELADSNSKERVSIEYQPIIDNFIDTQEENEATKKTLSSLLEDWNNLEPEIKDLQSQCFKLEQELMSLKTEKVSKSVKVETLRQKIEVR